MSSAGSESDNNMLSWAKLSRDGAVFAIGIDACFHTIIADCWQVVDASKKRLPSANADKVNEADSAESRTS
jgi:hypothetical protein